jgi:hypothetical protein
MGTGLQEVWSHPHLRHAAPLAVLLPKRSGGRLNEGQPGCAVATVAPWGLSAGITGVAVAAAAAAEGSDALLPENCAAPIPLFCSACLATVG